MKTIVVPDISSWELLRLARSEVGFKLDPESENPHGFTVHPGTYEVSRRLFSGEVYRQEVYAYFASLGFHGNTSAFVQWMRRQKPWCIFRGYASLGMVPQEHGELERRAWVESGIELMIGNSDRRSQSPSLIRSNGRWFSLSHTSMWFGVWEFLAFRKL